MIITLTHRIAVATMEARCKMPIPSDKELKVCVFCKKSVANLATHIINQHPSIAEQLEEKSDFTRNPTSEGQSSPQISRPFSQNAPISTIGREVDDAVRTAINIKLLKMLEANPDMSIKQLKEMVDPAPVPSIKDKLEEYKLLKDLFGGKEIIQEEGSGSNQWLEIIGAALPIVKEMLPSRKKQLEENKNDGNGRIEEGSIRTIKPICEEITGDPTEPGSTSEEPGDPVEEQQ